MRSSNLPIIGIVVLAVSCLQELSAAALIWWFVGVGILAFCGGRRFARKPDDKAQVNNSRNHH